MFDLDDSQVCTSRWTRTGLKIRAELDLGTYPSDIKVTEAEFQTLHLKPQAFHGDWNYALLPQRKTK